MKYASDMTEEERYETQAHLFDALNARIDDVNYLISQCERVCGQVDDVRVTLSKIVLATDEAANSLEAHMHGAQNAALAEVSMSSSGITQAQNELSEAISRIHDIDSEIDSTFGNQTDVHRLLDQLTN